MAKKSGKLAARYARALLGSVEKELGTSGSPTPAQSVAVELRNFANTWQSDQEFSSALQSPMFDRAQRATALEAVAKEAGVSDIARKFLKVLFERDRIGALPEISSAYAIASDKAAAVVRVTVRTARGIEDSEVKEIESAVSGKLGGTPEFSWEIEPELLGGLVIEYSGQVLDGSLNGQLTRFEKELTP